MSSIPPPPPPPPTSPNLFSTPIPILAYIRCLHLLQIIINILTLSPNLRTLSWLPNPPPPPPPLLDPPVIKNQRVSEQEKRVFWL